MSAAFVSVTETVERDMKANFREFKTSSDGDYMTRLFDAVLDWLCRDELVLQHLTFHWDCEQEEPVLVVLAQ